MKGLWHHFLLSLRLHFRNRLALLYGYLFPLIFLVAFWVLYRYQNVPLLRHMGALLTVSVLGGACFGLPTTLVSERERGVWRRYRLTPMPLWTLIASTMMARFALIASAGLLQFGAALATGLPLPAHPVALVTAFTLVTFAFMGIGLLMATLANNVPAVQALGQCVFLPMLIIGGVAVPLATLPEWAQHVSAFFPGRYAVEALQAAINGEGLAVSHFNLGALVLTGIAATAAGVLRFSWDPHGRITGRGGRGWTILVLAAWLAVGVLAETRKRVLTPAPVEPARTTPAAPELPPEPPKKQEPPPVKRAPWEDLSPADTAALNFDVPPDIGVVAPIASAGDEPEDYVHAQLESIRKGLPGWAPGNDPDPVVAVRNLLCVAGVPDGMQQPVESFVPQLVWRRLTEVYPKDKCVKILTWIVLHPEEGDIITDITELGVPGAVGDPGLVRERVYLYALKFLARLTDRANDATGSL